MSDQPVRIDFYRMEGENGDGSKTKKLLQIIKSQPDDESRTKELDDVPFRIQVISQSGRFWDGDIIRIRMTDLPAKVSLSGSLGDIDLEDDEGLGEETAFRFDSQTNVVAIQANRFGVSISKLSRFLAQFGKGHDLPAPVIEKDAIAVLMRMKEIRKFHITYAAVKNMELLVDSRMNDKEKVELVAASAPKVELTVSMGRESGSLPIRSVRSVLKKTVDWATGADGSGGAPHIERIDVTGADDEETLEMNLLQYAMREKVSVGKGSSRGNQSDRRASYDDRIKAVRAAWKRRQTELEEMFPSEDGDEQED